MGMGGESWSRRLASECKEIVYDLVGEDEVFEMYKGKDFGKTLCKASGHCSGKAPGAKKKEKKKEDKKSEKKTEKKAKKEVDPTKDPITLQQYVKNLSSRGIAEKDSIFYLIDITTKKFPQKTWDDALIKLSEKLSASATKSSDEL